MNKFWTAVVVVVVVAGAVWWMKGGNVDTLLMPAASSSPSSMPSVSQAPVKSGYRVRSASPVLTVPGATTTYSQLVLQYGANRIQFDQNCQAQPSSVVFKNGTSILLDNRANQARTIGVNGQIYNLDAYGYRVVTLSSPSVPKTISLSCNNLVNVGTIQLQANISGQ